MTLTRSHNGMIGGVAAGIAEALNLDATIVRIIFVLIAIFGGSGVLIYLVLWALIPARRAAPSPRTGSGRPRPGTTSEATRANSPPPTTSEPHNEAPPAEAGGARSFHSHSMVPGGLLVMSSATRLTSGHSLVMRLEIFSNSS